MPATFSAVFMADIVDAWAGFPMRETLRGMALVILSHPTKPLSLLEYIAIGQIASYDPVATLYSRYMRQGAPASTVAAMYDPVSWRIMKSLQMRGLHNIRALPSHYRPTVLAALDYFGCAFDVEIPTLRKLVHAKTVGVPSVFHVVKVDTGVYDIMWKSTADCLAALKTTKTVIELHPISSSFKPENTFAVNAPIPSGIDTFSVCYADRISWAYLGALLK